MMLLYLKSGSATVSHQGYEGFVEGGSFFLIDGAYPHELEMKENFSHLALRMSKSKILAVHNGRRRSTFALEVHWRVPQSRQC